MLKAIKQAQPLTPDILLDILAQLDLEKKPDLVFWATLVIGFFGMLRKSNLMPDTKKGFDPSKQLMRSHIYFQEYLAILRITWVKNIQFRQRTLEIPLFAIPGSPLCPVTLLKLLMKNPGKPQHPLFGIKGKVVFTYSQFQTKLRKVLKAAGYRECAFSTHSMRCGGGCKLGTSLWGA